MNGEANTQECRKTINLFLFLSAFGQLAFGFHASTYVLFLISHGLNLFEVNLVNVVFYAAIVLFEVPTGVVADVFGRKISYLISCLLFSVGQLVYFFSGAFLGFALAELCVAIAKTFSTGAYEAWMVDRLKYYGWNGSLEDVYTSEQKWTCAAGVAGSLIGATSGMYSLAWPWLLGSVSYLLVFVLAAVLMKEENFKRQNIKLCDSFAAMKETFWKSLGFVQTSEIVRFVMLMGLTQSLVFQAPNMQWTPFYEPRVVALTGAAWSQLALGVVYNGITVTIALGGLLIPWVLRKCGNEKTAIVATQVAIGVLLIAAAGISPLSLSLCAFYLHEVGRGVAKPIKSAYLNRNIPEGERATLISFESMAAHLGGTVGLLLFGALAEWGGICLSWTVAGAILAATAILHIRNGKK